MKLYSLNWNFLAYRIGKSLEDGGQAMRANVLLLVCDSFHG